MDAAQADLQAARDQINSCAVLSQAGRREEGLAAVEAAQQTLRRLLAEVGNFAGHREVQWFLQEVHVLQIAALLAQALEEEEAVGEAGANTGEVATNMEHERRAFSFYADAKKLAETALPPSHVMVALTRRLWTERAVCVFGPARRPVSGGQPSAPTSGLQLPRPDSARPPMRRSASSGAAPPRGQSDVAVRAAPSKSASTSSSRARRGSQDEETKQKRAHIFKVEVPRQPRNIFAEFIDEDKKASMMRKGFFNNRQEDLRKQVRNTARLARLANVGKNVAELADTRFRRTGHRIQVKALNKDNLSRSDPSLLSDAKAAGLAPEVALARQLRMQLEPKVEKVLVKKEDPKEKIFKGTLAMEIGEMFRAGRSVVDHTTAFQINSPE
mmetsp:Transcript_124943/g.233652  ORF Transcript_124943/g.233652 Transcript_124943/m.233652 type:complete len:385 (-) Transcript_124943:187-1341(-)